MDQITQDQASADYDKSISVDQAGADYDKSIGNTDSFTGHFADQYFTPAISAGGRILHAFNQGAAQEWGADTHGSNIDESLKKVYTQPGVVNNFIESHKNFAKGVNEAIIRPWAHLADTAINTFNELQVGVPQAVGQTGEELDNAAKSLLEDQTAPSWSVSKQILAPALGEAGELLRGFAPAQMDTSDPTNRAQSFFGAELGGFPERATIARARGVIGEGEEGYFNTRPPTPEQMAGRIEAFKESGQKETPLPSPPQTDPHILAREIDPETMKEWDRLHDEQENLRLSLQAERTKRRQAQEVNSENLLHPDITKAEGNISELQGKIQTADEGIRDLLPDVAGANQRGEALLEDQSPEGSAFRDYIQNKKLENELKLQGLNDQVNLAYSHADDLIPEKTDAEVGKEAAQAVSSKAAERDKVAKSTAETPDTTVSNKEPSGKTEATSSSTTETIPIEGTGDTHTRGLAGNVEARAVEAGLTDTGFSDLPEMQSLDMKDQAQKAAEFVNRDPLTAKRVALGHELPPEGIHPLAVHEAMVRRAIKLGDTELARNLAVNSTLSTRVSESARDLRILQERGRDPTNPVAAIQEVQDARMKSNEAKIVTESDQATKDIQKELDKLPEVDWLDFINRIECK